MINLPKILIYQDRTDLQDYLDGNELNKALYDALLPLVTGNSILNMISQALSLRNVRILAAFNRAYYLCTLADNDPDACLYIADYRNYDYDYDAYGMALAILSLQRNPSDNVRCVLKSCKRDLIPPYCMVVQSFRDRGKTFDMNFSVRLPDLDSLVIDWEKATRGFDRSTIERLVGLGADCAESRALCRKIWDAYKASSRQNMPHVEVNDSFFSTIYYQRYGGEPENLNIVEKDKPSLQENTQTEVPVIVPTDDRYWVRRVVDYAKGCYDWAEAKPFRDMLNHLLRGTADDGLFSMVDEIEAHFHQTKKQNSVNIDQAGNVFVNPQNVNNHG